MAYTSRAWISGWSYDKNGSDFNATVGRILSHGVDYDTSVESIRTTRRIAAENQHNLEQQTLKQQQSKRLLTGDATPTSSSGPRPGYAWLDDKGNVVDSRPAEDPVAALRASAPTQPTSSSPYATLNAGQRSMAIWKRISPGMLPGTSQTPASMMKTAYVWEGELSEPKDLTHHLKKTDFSAYTECALKHMHHIKAAAKK